MKKFLLTLLLTLSSAVAFAMSGSGTSSDPYLVKTADDLYLIKNTPNAYYKLMNDIDLTQWIENYYPESGWAPLCSQSSPFAGTLDGGDFTISGLFINRTTNYNGLIGYAKGATVKNLNINCNITGGSSTGSIIGYGSSITLTNCNVEGEIHGTSYVGGHVGQGSSFSASDCVFVGEISGNNNSGGIIGYASKLKLNKCAFEGRLNGADKVGGIVGYIEKTKSATSGMFYYSNINACYAYGNITSTGSYVGGLIGYDDSAYAYYSYPVSSKVSSKIDDCFFKGNINAMGTYVGGIVGYACGEYRRCLSEGTVSGRDYVGGIAGYLCGAYYNYYGQYGDAYTYTYESCMYSCVCLCSTIKAKEGHLRRGCNPGSYYVLGKFGTINENKALSECKLCIDENITVVQDSESDFYGATEYAFKRPASYLTIGWDFTDIWGIDEGNDYPFLRFRQPSILLADELILTDAAPSILAGTYESDKVKYQRVATGEYASFCLPFDVDLSAAEGIEKVYMPMEQILYNTQTQYLMMFLKEQDMTSTVEAGMPFLAKIADSEVCFSNVKRVSYSEPLTSNPTEKPFTVFDFDGKSGVLYQNNTLNVTWGGTYVATAATTGLNSFNINGSFGQHSGTLSPYRAYVMQTTKSGANSNVRGIQLNLGDDEGEVTSIFQLLNASAATESIYDMQGRRVINPQQGGLYIINGKKVRL